MFGDNLSESEGELNGIVEYENHIVLLSSSIYKITVSNLPWKTNTKILLQTFSVFGSIKYIDIIYSKVIFFLT